MSYKRLTDQQIAQIMKLKSLGYTNQDIAYRIGCSEPAVSYHLKQIHGRAESGEEDELFWGLVAIAAGIGIVELLRRLRK